MSLKFNNTTIDNVTFKDAAHPNGVTLCKLKYNGTLVWESHAYGSWTTTTAATCTTAGSKKRTCTRTGCGCYETGTINATGHKWSDASYMWDTSTANPSCTATRSCSNVTHKGGKFESAAGTVTSNITNATCTSAGLKAYTARFGVPWAAQQYKEETIAKLAHTQVTDTAVAATCTTAGKTEGKHCSVCNTVITAQTTIPALGHDWRITPEYQWSGFTSCEATRRCNRDTSHKETSTTTNITSKVTTAATCTATGVRTYTATFPSSASWAGTSTTTEILSKIDHTYTVTYSWNGYTACTATRRCSSCGHSESVSAARITNDGVSQTCTQSAVRTYTATFNSSWAGTSQKTKMLAALGHSFSPAGSAWNGVTECIATGLCVNDQTHITTQKGTITSKTTPATCTTPGYTIYTATFSKLPGWTKAPDTNTKQVKIAATGHDWTAATCTEPKTCSTCGATEGSARGHTWNGWTTIINSTCYQEGKRSRRCTRCYTEEHQTLIKAPHTEGDWIIDTPATYEAAGTKTKRCTVCGEVIETETIPMLNNLSFSLLSDGTGYEVSANGDVSGEIIIPSMYKGKAVTEISDSAFSGYAEITSVVIPNSITSISDSAFEFCSSLTSIVIPNSVTSIGYEAFCGCSNLKSVTIPSSVEFVGSYAFAGCDSLTITCNVASIPDTWCSDWNCDELPVIWGIKYTLSDDGTYYTASPANRNIEGNFIIRSKWNSKPVTGISGFAYCIKLTGITIPSTVETISCVRGKAPFVGCKGLLSVSLEHKYWVVSQNATGTVVPETVAVDLSSYTESALATYFTTTAMTACVKLKPPVIAGRTYASLGVDITVSNPNSIALDVTVQGEFEFDSPPTTLHDEVTAIVGANASVDHIYLRGDPGFDRSHVYAYWTYTSGCGAGLIIEGPGSSDEETTTT